MTSTQNNRQNELIDTVVKNDSQFEDNYQTAEQKARDCEITELLKQYVSAYSDKVEAQHHYRKFLVVFCSIIIGMFSAVFLAVVVLFFFWKPSSSIEGTASIISVCVTFLISILGLVKIITRYCFPEKDEEYITKIVEVISSNDLSHKLANMNNLTPTADKKRKIVQSAIR